MKLLLGDYVDVLHDESWDTLISDPPYSDRTHTGHSRSKSCDGSPRKSEIHYRSWSDEDVNRFVDFTVPRTSGWFVAMTSHDLFRSYHDRLEHHGRYVFHPVPVVIRGMTVRLGGDGPSSWCIWCVVSRPRNTEFSSWGTLPGAYITGRRREPSGFSFIGGKPLHIMRAIVRDYSRHGDKICDPCLGGGTTAIAAESEGRRFVGSEIDPDSFARSKDRIETPCQVSLF